MAEQMITSLEDLVQWVGADGPNDLNHRMYKDTECGASISVRLPNGKWLHNGMDWSGITEIDALTIQTIVEGSDVTVDSDVFDLPVSQNTLEEWMKEMEGRASREWERANYQHYTVKQDGDWWATLVQTWGEPSEWCWDIDAEDSHPDAQLAIAKAIHQGLLEQPDGDGYIVLPSATFDFNGHTYTIERYEPEGEY